MATYHCGSCDRFETLERMVPDCCSSCGGSVSIVQHTPGEITTPNCKTFDELTEKQQNQVRAIFAPIVDYRLYAYELTGNGLVLCRRLIGEVGTDVDNLDLIRKRRAQTNWKDVATAFLIVVVLPCLLALSAVALGLV